MRFFILSCGTTACYNFAKKIKANFPEIYLIGVDTNSSELVATTNYLDEFYTVLPSSNNNDYYVQILSLLDATKPDYIIPSFDVDQQLFFDGNSDLSKRDIISLGIPESTVTIYRNKLSMNEQMNNFHLPLPIRYTIKSSDINRYFAKPLNGVASIGAKVISAEVFDKYKNEGFLIQEVCNGPEITVQCFRVGNYFRCVCRERIQTKSGVCTKTKIFFDQDLNDIAKNFSDSIRTPIIFNLQFMKNQKLEWVITDVNLRMAGGGYLSAAVGWDEVSALVSYLKNKDTSLLDQYLPKVNGETYVIATTAWEITKSRSRN